MADFNRRREGKRKERRKEFGKEGILGEGRKEGRRQGETDKGERVEGAGRKRRGRMRRKDGEGELQGDSILWKAVSNTELSAQ